MQVSSSFTVVVFLHSALLAVSLAVPVRGWDSDYVQYPVHQAKHNREQHAQWLRKEVIRDRVPNGYSNYVAHAYVVSDPVHHFAVLPPWQGCGHGLAIPQETAEHYPSSCKVALNGGFFDPFPNTTHRCYGNIISDTRSIQWNWAGMDASFGLGYPRRPKSSPAGRSRPVGPAPVLVTGYLNETDRAAFEWLQYISGFGWLVREGENVVRRSVRRENSSVQTTGTGDDFRRIRAPRSAIGHDILGRVVLFAVDGQEDLWNGVSLDDLADILVGMGLVNAINIDGGGSVSVWEDGTLVNVPSDQCPNEEQLSIPTPQPSPHPTTHPTPQPQKGTSPPTAIPPKIPPGGRPMASDERVPQQRVPSVQWSRPRRKPTPPTLRCPRRVASILCATDQSLMLKNAESPTKSFSYSGSESKGSVSKTPSVSLSGGTGSGTQSPSFTGTFSQTLSGGTDRRGDEKHFESSRTLSFSQRNANHTQSQPPKTLLHVVHDPQSAVVVSVLFVGVALLVMAYVIIGEGGIGVRRTPPSYEEVSSVAIA